MGTQAMCDTHAFTPDYAHWARMARWDKNDAAALSLGIEPSALRQEALEDLPANVRQAFAKRFALIENHVRAGRLPHHPEPAEFLTWARANGLDVPLELTEAMRAQAGNIKDWRGENERLRAQLAASADEIGELKARVASKPGRPLRPKEGISLLKLVLGMAMAKYGYRPQAGRTSAAKAIADSLAAQGLRLDEDTVLKWLRKAAEEIEHPAQT